MLFKYTYQVHKNKYTAPVVEGLLFTIIAEDLSSAGYKIKKYVEEGILPLKCEVHPSQVIKLVSVTEEFVPKT